MPRLNPLEAHPSQFETCWFTEEETEQALSGTPELYLPCNHHLKQRWHSSVQGLALPDCLLRQNVNSSIVNEGVASWPCPWEQRGPERRCGQEFADISLQVEMVTEGLCLPHLKIWQSKSPLHRPYLRWCISVFQDTVLSPMGWLEVWFLPLYDNPQVLTGVNKQPTVL